MIADPEPEESVAFEESGGTKAVPDANRPDLPDFFEAKRRVLWIFLPHPVDSFGAFPYLRRQGRIQFPKVRSC